MNASDPVSRLCEAINSHDAHQVAGCFTVDYRAEIPHRPAESFTGSARVLANWTAIFAATNGLRARVTRRANAGDEVWSEWEITGTGPAGGPTLLVGPVVMTTLHGQINWARFYLDAVPPLN